ncbi:MAG: SH3 domain-containing protein, partial [Chloroflexi bacterium]|nr:SH3 domain-containing protein [Chloroflexota bacterium]
MMNEGYQSVTSLLRNLARIGILGGVAIIFVSFPGAIVGADESTNRASQACYVQVELTYWADLRRGPSYNYGVKRRIPSEQELRVLARDESGDWFQAHLGDPWNKIGWLRNENLQFYGRCWDLPVVSDPAAYEPENATPAPTEVPLPAFARGMDFVPDDRMFLLNDGMLYVRHEANDLRVHIVIADLANPQLDVHTALALTEDKRLGWVSDLARETGAFVALNGDFYASNFLPQGFMLVEGEVVTAPKHRATFAITADHEPFIGYFTDGWTWDAQLVTSDEEAHPLQLWNLPCAEDWLCVHTDFWDELPRQQGYDGLHV